MKQGAMLAPRTARCHASRSCSTTATTATCSFLLSVAFSASAIASDIDKNTNGLPSYPHLNSTLMAAHDRIQNNIYDDFKQDSPDNIADVKAWYRKTFSGARETSTGGNYPGIKLTRGKDVIWIYQFPGMKTTSIEAMKYVGPAPDDP